MNESQEQLWRASASGACVEIEPDALLASLRRRGQLTDRQLRIAEMADLWGGVALIIVLAWLIGREPELVTEAPVAGLVGFALLVVHYAAYHVQGFFARARTDTGAPSMLEFLRAEREHVVRRVRLLKWIWFHTGGAVVGAVLLIHASFDGLAASLGADAAVLIACAGICWFSARVRRDVYEPLRSSLDAQLGALGDGS